MSKSAMTVRGFFRIKLGEDKNGKTKIVGDSGWHENEVVNLGFQNYICFLLAGSAGSKVLDQAMIGTGGAPNVTANLLAGSTMRQTVGFSVSQSKTLRCTLSIASSDHPGGTPSISNIGLLDTATHTSDYTIMCGNVYDSSEWNNNQGLSATYDLQFATTS